MIIYEKRASSIIYNFLRSIDNERALLIPANICPIVVVTFLKARRKFEFVDISNQTLCMDENIVLDKIRNAPNKYAGVLFVRTYGIMSSFEYFFKQIKETNDNLILIDDRCLTVPDFSRPNNTYADILLFSTGYSKFVDIGFGGFALAKDSLNYQKHAVDFNRDCLEKLISGIKFSISAKKKFHYEDSDWLDSLYPEIAFDEYRRMVSEKINESFKIKNALNKIYFQNLPKEVQLKPDYQIWRFNIMVPCKDLLIKDIFDNGLFASSHYSSLSGIFDDGFSEVSDNLHSKIINIFNDRYFSVDKAFKITEIINSHLDRYS